MVYLWQKPKNCTNRMIAEYDRDNSPDRFLFNDGKYLAPETIVKKPIFIAELSCERMVAFDCIPNNSASPLVNSRLAELLLEYAKGDVQFFEAEVHCKDGLLQGYQFLNITSTVKGVDHEQSIYHTFKQADGIMGFRRAVYKPDCMQQHNLARGEEYLGYILVSEELKQQFKKAKIKGVWLPTPEELYAVIFGS